MIRLYNIEKDKSQLVEIAYYHWNKEIDVSERLKKLIYEFLVDYYSFDNDISFVSEIDNKIYAFMLLNYPSDKNESVERFMNKLNSLSVKEKEDGIRYIDYLKNNTMRVKKYLKDNDVYFDLLASIKHNEGTNIFNYAIDNCRKLGKNNGYFWTDETCNYEYYLDKGFRLIEVFDNDFFGTSIKTFIYKIELR